MSRTEKVLQILRELGRPRANVVPLGLLYRKIVDEGVYASYRSIRDCLKRLEVVGKIKPVNFGVNIKLLEDGLRIEKVKETKEGIQRWFKWMNRG